MLKKITITILIFFFISLPIAIFMYTNPNSIITVTIEKYIPDNLKKIVVSNLFSYQNLKKDVNYLQKELAKNKSEINELKLKLNNFILENSNNQNILINKRITLLQNDLKLSKYELPFHSWDLNEKPVAYTDFYKDFIFVISGDGKITYLNKDNLKSGTIKLKVLNNNIKDIIKDELFYDIRNNANESSYQVSIKDILVHKEKLYISYTKEIKKNCYNTSIIVSNINFNKLIFKDFFSYDECIVTKKENLNNFYVLVSGGRMIIKDDNKMLFTIGDYRNSNIAQKDDSLVGKIISIDINSNKYEIFSKGHRNPQGLLYDKDENIILSTEHGPKGGDEINLINKGNNYGWPISSYGEPYSGVKTKEMTFYKSHEKYGNIEPIFTFSNFRNDGINLIGEKNIAIGISQLININKESKFSKFGNYAVTTMKDKSIYFFNFDSKFSKVTSAKKIKINERIRDIIYNSSSDSIIFILENSPAMGILE